MTQHTTSSPRDAMLRAERVGIAEWPAMVNRSFVPLQVDPLALPFVGTLGLTVVDDVAVFEIAATAHRVRRTPELITAGEAFYKLSLQLDGVTRLTQDGRTALVQPGNLGIYDTTRPYELLLEGDNRAFVIMFPQRLVDLPQSTVAEVTAVEFSHESVLGRVIIPFLTALGGSIDRLRGAEGTRLVRTALDLLMTLLSSEVQISGDPRQRLAHGVRQYIVGRLGDPGLTPSSIAQAHFISTRHLHAIFSAEGVTLAAWIRERRLERIRRDLSDPRHAADSLHQIATRWGLPDAAHFSRLFRARFGASPSDYRRRALPDKGLALMS